VVTPCTIAERWGNSRIDSPKKQKEAGFAKKKADKGKRILGW